MIFAPIDEVRMYRDSAVVRRKATVGLQAGTNEILISGLSRFADPDSLRLFLSEGIIGKDVQILSLAKAVDRLPSQDVKDEIAELKSRLETLKNMETLWLSNGNFEKRGECSNETIESYLEALPSHLEKLRADRRELVRHMDELNKKKEKLEQTDGFQVVRLVLESPEACQADCEMEYLEKSAQWKSTYEIHSVTDSPEISVVSRARITQNTGEDWENVRVSLSTGNPTSQQKIPTLKKLGLRFSPAFTFKKKAAPRFAASASVGASAPGDTARIPLPVMAAAAPVTGMVMEEAEETDAETMTVYNLPGRRTIPAGSTGTVADYKTETVPAEKRIVCIPKLENSAYLAAMIKTENWTLKPSRAKIYLNDNYCGEVYVAPNLIDDEVFMLSLGKDERIGLERAEIRCKTENVLLKGQKRKIFEYAIRISNYTDKPQTVLVWDQIPVSMEKQIIVDRVSVDGASVDEETGRLNWSLTVQGKTTAVKRLAYSVTYPKDQIYYEVLTETGNGLKTCPECGDFAEGMFCPNCGHKLE